MDYRALYFRLFACLADVVDAIDGGQIPAARELLVKAMQQAEEQYLDGEE